MNKITLYNSNMRHNSNNKYSTNTILESNLTFIKEVNNPLITHMDDINLNFNILAVDINKIPNYIKLELKTSTYYYFVKTYSFNKNQSIFTILCEIDLFHSYIKDFYKGNEFDRDVILDIQQATVRRDIWNLIPQLYNNPYLRHIPVGLENIKTISTIDQLWTFDNRDFGIVGSPQIVISESQPFNIIEGNNSVNAFLNLADMLRLGPILTVDNIIKGLKKHCMTVALVNTNSWVAAGGKRIDDPIAMIIIDPTKTYSQNVVDPGYKVYNKDGVRYNDHNVFTGGWGDITKIIPTANLLGVYSLPFSVATFTASNTMKNNHVFNVNFQESTKEYIYTLFPLTLIYQFKNDITYPIYAEIFNIDYNIYDDKQGLITYKQLYNKYFYKSDKDHSALFMWYSYECILNDRSYKIDPINFQTYIDIDDPNTLIPKVNCQIHFAGGPFNITMDTIYENDNYINIPRYKKYYATAEFSTVSTSNEWTNYHANHQATSTTGLALSAYSGLGDVAGKSSLGYIAGNYAKQVDLDKVKHIAWWGEHTPAIGGAIGAGMAVGSNAVGLAQRLMSYHDMKVAPQPLNSGAPFATVANVRDNWGKLQVNHLTDFDRNYLNYYFKYYGNVVSEPMSINRWIPDKSTGTSNYLKITDFFQCMNTGYTDIIRSMLNELFKNGVRIWDGPIDIK